MTVIRHWDIETKTGDGYHEATGTDVMSLIDALKDAAAPELLAAAEQVLCEARESQPRDFTGALDGLGVRAGSDALDALAMAVARAKREAP